MKCLKTWLASVAIATGVAAMAPSMPAFASPTPPALLLHQVDGFFISQGGTRIARQQTDNSHDFFASIAATLTPTGGFTPTLVFLPPNGNGASPACSLPTSNPTNMGGCSDAIAVLPSGTFAGYLDVYMLSDHANAMQTSSFFTAINDPNHGTAHYVLGPAETGLWQDITSLFGNGGADPTFAIFVQSEVPEVTSLVLFGTALVGLAAIRRRRTV